MNKLAYILTFALSLNMFSAQAQDASFLTTKYHHLLDNVKLIKKCYLQKSVPCTEIEQKKARKMIASGILLITTLYALTVGYRFWRLLSIHDQNTKIRNAISFIVPVNGVEIRGSDVMS